jgi:hypothetical protein
MSATVDKTRIFTRLEVENLLKAAIGKTLLQVDTAKLFEQHAGSDKVTGIVGHIVEASILGCKIDNEQKPDILIDNVPHEVKATGMIKPKKKVSIKEKSVYTLVRRCPSIQWTS